VRYFAYTGADRRTHVQSVEHAPALSELAVLEGELAYTTMANLFVLKVNRDGVTTFRVVGPTGQPVVNDDYEDFRTLGCDFLEVKKQGKWLTLKHDGSTTEKRFYPFSC
jgi:hypothetical protein